MSANKKVNWYDGQKVDEQDLDTEQLYNKNVNSQQVEDFNGSGVKSEHIEYPVLLEYEASERTTSVPMLLDGIGIDVDDQPTDTTFGNQLKVTIDDAVFGTATTKIYIFGRVYDGSKDSKSSIAIEMLEFDAEESQITQNYFISVLGVVTQNFFGNMTPSSSSTLEHYNYEATLEPDDSGNTYIWTRNALGSNISEEVTTDEGRTVFRASHSAGETLNYILPLADLRGNRYYYSNTAFKVDGVTTTSDDPLHPTRNFTNIWPIFCYDGSKAIGCTLIDEGGTQAVALFDIIDYLNNNNVLPGTSVITPFSWNDGEYHQYNLEVSVDNNTVILTCDSTTILSATYSSFTTYVGGLSFDLTFNSNTYVGFSTGINNVGNVCNIMVDWHRQTMKGADATECSSDRTQQIVGTLTIEEAEPLVVARDVVMAEQSIDPNIKFRSVSYATNTLGNIIEPAFRVYNPDDGSVSVESIVLDIIGGSIYTDDLLETVVTIDPQTLSLPYNTSLDTIIGQKFLAETNNIQKVRILLSVQQDTSKTGEDQYDWSGDLIIGIRKLATTTACPSDEAPVNAVDYDPEFSSVVEVSLDQEDLLNNFGITLTDVPMPIDFDFSQTTISTPGNITVDEYYAITIRRSGDIRTGTILVQKGADHYDDGRVTIFDGSSWTDDSNSDLWFQVFTDAVRINSGTAYDRGIRIVAEKTSMNSTTGILEQDAHRYNSLVNAARAQDNYVIVEESESGTDIEAHPRTGNQTFSRLEDVPSFSVMGSTSLDALKNTLYPVTLACVRDNNCRTPFTLTEEIPYIGQAIGDSILFIDSDDNFTTLSSEDLRGCIIAPDVNTCDSLYRIVQQGIETQYYGDINGDGVVDADDLVEFLNYENHSLSSSSTQEAIIGRKRISYSADVLPQNSSSPWVLSDDTDPGVTVSTAISGGVLTLNKSGSVVAPADDTSYRWFRDESLLGATSSWEVQTRMRITAASFLSPTGSIVGTKSIFLMVVEGLRAVSLICLYDRLNNRKYIGVGISADALNQNTFDLTDYVITATEVDFTEFHTYKLERTTTGLINVYIDGSTTAAISTAITNAPLLSAGLGISDSIYFGDGVDGAIVMQWDYVNYLIESAASINIETFLRADVNGDGIVDNQDYALIVDHINNGTDFPNGNSFRTVKLTLRDLDNPCETVDLIEDISNLSEVLYSPVTYRLTCGCVWSERKIQITDIRRLLNNTIMENGLTNCSDKGKNIFYSPNNMYVGGEILAPTGSPHHFDWEVSSIEFELPTFPWLKAQLNVFDNFIKNSMKFSDGTYVGSDALQNNQIRVTAAIQSQSDFYEYNLEGDNVDGYDGYDGYGDSNIAVYNPAATVEWDPYPDNLIVGQDPWNGGESSVFLRFPINAGDPVSLVNETLMPFILNAMLQLTANHKSTGIDEIYKLELVRSRDVPSFNDLGAPPTVFAVGPGGGTMVAPLYFRFNTSISSGELVKFPVTGSLSFGEWFQDIDELEEAVVAHNALQNLYGGASSLKDHIHMFIANQETVNNQSFNEIFGQAFQYGQHIGWKISRHTTTSAEYVSFDPGLVNYTRTPKLNLVTIRGALDAPSSFTDVYGMTIAPSREHNALYFDHTTGTLHINYFMPVSSTSPDAKTKIVLTVYLKKAGFNNSNVSVTSSRLLNLLNLSASP